MSAYLKDDVAVLRGSSLTTARSSCTFPEGDKKVECRRTSLFEWSSCRSPQSETSCCHPSVSDSHPGMRGVSDRHFVRPDVRICRRYGGDPGRTVPDRMRSGKTCGVSAGGFSPSGGVHTRVLDGPSRNHHDGVRILRPGGKVSAPLLCEGQHRLCFSPHGKGTASRIRYRLACCRRLLCFSRKATAFRRRMGEGRPRSRRAFISLGGGDRQLPSCCDG